MIKGHLKKYGRWACVIGAAEGLGASFCKDLARRGFNLLMVDQQEEKLGLLAEELKLRHQIKTDSLFLQLEAPHAVRRILTQMEYLDCRLLIYNAAYGPVKHFLGNSAQEIDRYVTVNIRRLLQLTYKFAQGNVMDDAGILFVSSLAGFHGTQYAAPYSASKAFTWNLAEGLHYEFQGTPMDISVLCPGATDTPGYRASHPLKSWLTPKVQNPDFVAKTALDSFGKKLFIIPGWNNKLTHWAMHYLLPRNWSGKLFNYAMRKIYKSPKY